MIFLSVFLRIDESKFSRSQSNLKKISKLFIESRIQNFQKNVILFRKLNFKKIIRAYSSIAFNFYKTSACTIQST